MSRLIVFLLLILPFPANAFVVKSVGDMAKACEYEKNTNEYVFCTVSLITFVDGYIHGVSTAGKAPTFCINDSINSEQYRDVFLKFAKDNTKDNGLTWQRGLMKSLRQSFPCDSGK